MANLDRFVGDLAARGMRIASLDISAARKRNPEFTRVATHYALPSGSSPERST
jgi:hypothetical protein